MKARSFGHSVFGRLSRNFGRILLGSTENGRDPRLRKPAPEAGRLLKDRREHSFANRKVFKTFQKPITLCRFFFSWDWDNESTLHCNGFNSLRGTTTFELSFFQNSHSFGIFLCEVCQPYCFQNAYSFGIFSSKSADSTVFRVPILLVTEIFLCEAYRFQKTSQTSDAQKNAPLVLTYKNLSTIM